MDDEDSFLLKALKKKLGRRGAAEAEAEAAAASLSLELVRGRSVWEPAEEAKDWPEVVSSSPFMLLFSSMVMPSNDGGTGPATFSTPGTVQFSSSTGGNSWRHPTANLTNCSGDFFLLVRLDKKEEPEVGMMGDGDGGEKEER